MSLSRRRKKDLWRHFSLIPHRTRPGQQEAQCLNSKCLTVMCRKTERMVRHYAECHYPLTGKAMDKNGFYIQSDVSEVPTEPRTPIEVYGSTFDDAHRRSVIANGTALTDLSDINAVTSSVHRVSLSGGGFDGRTAQSVQLNEVQEVMAKIQSTRNDDGQQTLANMTQWARRCGPKEQRTMEKMLALWIVDKNLSLSVMESPFFKMALSIVNPRSTVPTVNKIKTKLIPAIKLDVLFEMEKVCVSVHR